jgi:hypothetical protein
MSNINTEGLPPEMQARIADIIEKAKANAITPGTPGLVPNVPAAVPQPPAPIQRPPSLMDHVIALRQEVADLRSEVANMTQQVNAVGQVSEAVGNAVGQMYAMFQQQTTLTDSSSTYSQNFQEQVTDEDY